jgi:hypothetical protein
MRLPRQTITNQKRTAVLTESGYRCAVPTCRNILAIDLHHIEEVSEGGGNELGNLIALCPTCHALFHRGTISRDAIYSWKSLLVSLNLAFDKDAIDNLLFLKCEGIEHLKVSGDGVLRFSRLIAANLVGFRLYMKNGPILIYQLGLTPKGNQLIEAWQAGDREGVAQAINAPNNSTDEL